MGKVAFAEQMTDEVKEAQTRLVILHKNRGLKLCKIPKDNSVVEMEHL